MDKNQTIGFVLIFALLAVYFWMTPQPEQNKKLPDYEQTEESADSLRSIKEDQTVEVEIPDSLIQAEWGIFSPAIKGTATQKTLENEELKVVFSSKGGKIESATLKKYKDPQGNLVQIISPQNNDLRWKLPTSLPQGEVSLDQLYFEVTKANSSGLTFRANLGAGKFIEQRYELEPEGYVLAYDLDVSSLQSNLSGEQVKVSWKDDLRLMEPSMEISRRYSTVNYYSIDGDFDQLTEASESFQEEEIESPLRWVAMKQRFFNAALITDAQFEKAKVTSVADAADSLTVKKLTADFNVPLATLGEAGNMRYYFGPNEFYTMEKVAEDFEDNVYLGWAVFSPISRYIILPLFTLLEKFISNYGVLIILMVVLIKLALAPLTYKGYFATAKTKVIQPEVAAIKEKYKDDKQKASQEQMKLMTQVGANPLSGCLPQLLQMPILFSLFMFFPVMIYLRGEPFLWASDLSNYDSILSLSFLPFPIPFYGNHVSAFTLLMAVAQLGSALISGQNMTQPQESPINMKALMYFMPIMLLFFFNSYPAGLTLYYFISSAITIVLMVVIRKFLIDDEKIKAIIERNREKNKNKKTSSFMSRLEEAQKAQEEAAKRRQALKQQKNRNKRKR
ncbi:MAG: membrane protein insertase YidC [Bacteroidota bacterium]